MLCLRLALFLICARSSQAVASSSLRQQPLFLSAEVAGELSLSCFSDAKDAAWIFWYKQTAGRKPVIISGYYIHDKSITFYDNFKEDPRFSLGMENGNYCLNISGLRTSDSGTYYCAFSKFYDFELAAGTVVSVQGLSTSVRASVRRSASEGSDTLECKVQTGTSDNEHWFQDSEGSHPGIIYTIKQAHTCDYNLLTRGLNTSGTGIDCVVASCGHVILGNWTEADDGPEEHDRGLVFLLSGTLAFTIVLTLCLVVSLCRSTCCQSTGSPGRSPSGAGCGNTANLHYAALNVEVPRRSRVNEPTTACVYSRIQQHT